MRVIVSIIVLLISNYTTLYVTKYGERVYRHRTTMALQNISDSQNSEAKEHYERIVDLYKNNNPESNLLILQENIKIKELSESNTIKVPNKKQ